VADGLLCEVRQWALNTLNLKLVAAALGMDPEGVMIYLADHVYAGRLAQRRENAPGADTA
jgi:hypothetical protein